MILDYKNSHLTEADIASLNQIKKHMGQSVIESLRLEAEEKVYEMHLQEKQIENQEEIIRLLKEQEKIKPESNPNSLPLSLIAKLGAVFSSFQQFEYDYPEMLKEGFVKIDLKRNGLETPYKKGFIYDYFKFISKDKNVSWKLIESLFRERTLRSALGERTMITQGMEKWAEFKGIDKDSIRRKIFSVDGKEK